MKHKIFPLAASAFLGIASLASCSDNWVPDLAEKEQGTLNTASIVPTVNTVENEKNTTGNVEKAASRAVTDLSSYKIEVVGSDGSVVSSWTYATMPAAPTFNVGTYTVNVKSHDVTDAEWDKPYYAGSQQFQIKANTFTDVDPIVCKLANIRTSVSFSEGLLEAAAGGDDITVTVTAAAGVSLDFTPSEKRSGYFAATPGLSTLKVHFVGTVSGVKEDFTRVIKDVEAGQHHKISFALTKNPNKPVDETGNIVIPEGNGINVDCGVTTVDVDAKVVVEEDVMDPEGRPGYEDPKGPDTPDTPDTPDNPDELDKVLGFTSPAGGLVLDAENDADEFGPDKKPAVVHIHSENGVRNLVVEIISDFLTPDMLASVGLTDKFDLANPGQYEEGLKGLGFPVGPDVVGQNDLDFNITEFLPLIFESGLHTFKITVTDSKALQNNLNLKIRKN